jgi:hypothetical protein
VPPAREVLDQLDPQLLGWVEAQWGTEVADADRLAGGVTSTMLRSPASTTIEPCFA